MSNLLDMLLLMFNFLEVTFSQARNLVLFSRRLDRLRRERKVNFQGWRLARYTERPDNMFSPSPRDSTIKKKLAFERTPMIHG
jgi:hypothetical protein